LDAIITRYQQIKQRSPSRAFFGWAAPMGRVYRSAAAAFEEQRSSIRYHLRWGDIAALVWRMQPGSGWQMRIGMVGLTAAIPRLQLPSADRASQRRYDRKYRSP